MKNFSQVLVLSAIALLCACSTKPIATSKSAYDKQRQTFVANLPSRWNNQNLHVEPSPPLVWGFNVTDELQQLLDDVSTDNLSLQIARLKQQQTLIDLDLANGERLPEVKLSVGSRRFQSQNDGETSWMGNYSAGVNASWEFDIWQRLEDGIKQKGALYQAQAYEYEAMRHSMQAQVLMVWLNVVEQSRLLTLNQANVQNQQRRLQLSLVRLDNGLAASVDIRNTRTSLLRLQESQRQLIFKRDQAVRQLHQLLGHYPSAKLNWSITLPELSDTRSFLTPTDILLHRPDVLAAEQKLLAAGFAWNASEKKRLPKLSFNISYDNRQSEFSDLFDLDFWLASVTSSIVQPIFYRGVLKQQADKAHLQHQSQWMQYKSVLLNAWLEVEAAMQNEHLLQVRQAYLEKALTQAKAAEQQVEIQYSSGLANSFELLSAQRTRTSVESDLVRMTISRMRNRIQLQLALGLPQASVAPKENS